MERDLAYPPGLHHRSNWAASARHWLSQDNDGSGSPPLSWSGPPTDQVASSLMSAGRLTDIETTQLSFS
ncbi:MAG: hypothetical protein M3Z24_02110 [Chloroflexota bacterium]|nr:hypothetical protein [Chloroflexota bacterium]